MLLVIKHFLDLVSFFEIDLSKVRTYRNSNMNPILLTKKLYHTYGRSFYFFIDVYK